MDDYPRTVAEFEARVATEDACRIYLSRLRWPDGFRCRCGEAKAWWTARGLWPCAACGAQTSVTAGTVFQATRTPLRLWCHARWWVTGQKTGASALGLQRLLGLGSDETAWTWRHKLRRAMVRPGRDRVSGRVEVDESVGGGAGGAQGRSTATKALIVIAAEEVGHALGRIRLRRLPDGFADSLHTFEQRSPAVCQPVRDWSSSCLQRPNKRPTLRAGRKGIRALPDHEIGINVAPNVIA